MTVGCPKIWVSDRIFTVLDGLLRDVDSVTLKDLQGLDPNSPTGAELLSVVTEFEANLKYDQGAAVGNALKLQKANAQRASDLQQFAAQQKMQQQNLQQQETLNQEFISLQNRERALVAARKSDSDPELIEVRAEKKLVQDQQKELTSTPAPTISDQAIGSSDTTQADQAKPSLTPLDQDALKGIFGDVFKNPNSPQLPAAMRMDNVIDLLKQRLAREFGVMYDDLARQSEKYDLYLAQFDVGVVPGRSGKRQHAQIQIAFTGGPTALAYDLFPAGSSYNTSRGFAKSSRIGISGAAQTLFGFGLSAAYTHSRNQYRSSLSQTMYVSAFGAGTSQFGWTFGTAPFEDFVSPGSRSVYAVLLVPHDPEGANLPITMTVTSCWLKDGRSGASDCQTGSPISFSLPAPPDPAKPSQQLSIVSYQPYYQHSVSSAGNSSTQTPAPPTTNTVQLVFTTPVDPNMTITVNDKILRRVRDVRGRALYSFSSNDKPPALSGNQAERDALNKSRFGILESDTLGDDTWFQVNSTTVLLNISRQTAGTDVFPVIRVSEPQTGGRDIFEMASDTDGSTKTKTRIAEWDFTPHTLNGVRSAFSPLFTEPYEPGRIKSYVDQVECQKDNPSECIPSRIRIISETFREGRKNPVWLHDQAQVVLESSTLSDQHPWALNCDEDEGTLECDLPNDEPYISTAKRTGEQLKVWVEEPPYYDRPGLWADTDLKRINQAWKAQPYALSGWSDVNEVRVGECSQEKCDQKPWDAWRATVRVNNLETNYADQYCVAGLPSMDFLLALENRLARLPGANSLQIKGQISGIRSLSEWGTHSLMIRGAGQGENQTTEQSNPDEKQTSPQKQTTPQEPNGPQKPTKTRKEAKPDKQNDVRQQFAPSPDETCGNSPVEVKLNPKWDSLSLTIPFETLPYLQDVITLEPEGCNRRHPECQDIILPKFKSSLLPGSVVLTRLRDGQYRLQGDHLKAVSKVRLIRDGNPTDLDAVVGINNVDFFVPIDGKAKLPDGSYGVYLLLGQFPIAASYEDGQKKLQPLTLSISKSDDTQSSNQNATHGQSQSPNQPPAPH